MKKLLVLILSVLLGLGALAAWGGDTDDSSSPVVTYDITYSAVIDGVKQEVPAAAWKQNGKYPESYEKGKIAPIDNLNTYDVVTETAEVKVLFQGWFTDEACTVSFTGITVETVGDLKLYAKISEAVQRTITLKGVKGSQEVEIPEQMKRKDGNYPSTYYEGIGAQVDTLKDYEDRNNEWRFLGWYTDKACTEKFEGTIDITQTGDVTLYAKLYYAAWSDPV